MAALLLAATLAAYTPALDGGPVWDDAAHLTREDLVPAAGLLRIWFDASATQQHYPVTHTAFWLMFRLWGADTAGYHVVNVTLHALSAFLVFAILGRLGVPGAMVAAAIFALHPVHVESVAWITELKNTLSGVLYLAALLVYLRFDDTRRGRAWALAFGLFVLALLSKTVVATLPGALLVVLWWRRGALRWREDVAPVLPFALVGVAAGVYTAWVEHAFVGAQGAEFQFTAIERGLIAGRAAWFYLGALVWPANLAFTYPRWEVSQLVWWQYVYPAAALAALGGLWRLRGRARAPLAAALFFGGTLVPALGFVNVYPFRFSFVADHFQYLASLGPIVLAAAGLTVVTVRQRRWLPEAALAVLVALPLGALTWRQSRQFENEETLYRTTIARNPAAWLARNNLAAMLVHGTEAQVTEAAAELREVLRLKPDHPEAHNNLGLALQRTGRFEDARREHQEAIRLKPDLVEAHYNLGLALDALGRLEEAAKAYERALVLHAAQPPALHNLAGVLARLGRTDEALRRLTEAAAISPSPEIRRSAGDVLLRAGRAEEAAAAYREALARGGDAARIRNNLGLALQRAGRPDEAVAEFEAAARLLPGSPMVERNLARALGAAGRVEDALAAYRRALAVESGPARAELHHELGVALAGLGRHREALAEFERALEIRPDFPEARANRDRARAIIGR